MHSLLPQRLIPLQTDLITDNNTNTEIKKDERKNPFGILVDRTDNSAVPLNKKIQVAKALGLNYIRVRTDIDTYNGTINNYDEFASAGFKIILNINYSVPRSATGEKQPVPFLVTDL